MYLSLYRISEVELADIRQDPEKLETYLDSDTSLSIDKAWHAIHFMLTGDSWDSESDLGRVIMGGDLIGEEGNEDFDFGYGPATYIPVDEVKVLSAKLSALDLEQQKASFSLSMFANKDIYIFSDADSVEDEDEEAEYLFENLEELVDYFQQAASEGQLIIKMIA